MTIKITAIGMSNAGKTCSLTALGGHKAHGVSNFEFKATNDGQREKLQRSWNSLLGANARWPAGTLNATEEFSFSCLCNGAPLFPGTSTYSEENCFKLVDYRGGLWNEEQGGDNRTTEIGELYGRSVNSDALIVAIPGDVLVKCVKNQDDCDVLDMLDQYWFVLDRLCQINLSAFQKTALVFAITKGDCIGSEFERDACVRKVKETFDFCFGASQRACMITRVSLGDFKVSGVQGGSVAGAGNRTKFMPHNLHLPILLPFYLQMREEEQSARNSANGYGFDSDYSRMCAVQESQKSPWTKFWYGDSSDAYFSRADFYLDKEKEYNRIADNLSSAVSKVKKELSGSSVLYEYGVRTI